jgi:hypothetical protein
MFMCVCIGYTVKPRTGVCQHCLQVTNENSYKLESEVILPNIPEWPKIDRNHHHKTRYSTFFQILHPSQGFPPMITVQFTTVPLAELLCSEIQQSTLHSAVET